MAERAKRTRVPTERGRYMAQMNPSKKARIGDDTGSDTVSEQATRRSGSPRTLQPSIVDDEEEIASQKDVEVEEYDSEGNRKSASVEPEDAEAELGQ